jgi:hypothetical protein
MEDQRNDPVAANKYNWDEAVGLMAYAMETVRRFRAKLGWPTGPSPLTATSYNTPFPKASPPG